MIFKPLALTFRSREGRLVHMLLQIDEMRPRGPQG
jgi:hypothetical protein